MGDQRLGAVGAAADGRLARVRAVPSAPVGRHRSGDLGPRQAACRDGRVRDPRPGPVSQRGGVRRSKHPRHQRTRAAALACIRSYNDYLTDLAAFAPGRYIPASSLPFWDLGETLAEIDRCAAHGHKGIVFTQDPSFFGLPELTDRYWDPMWASAQEKGMPVNFHIASGDIDVFHIGNEQNGVHANYAAMGVSFFMSNARTISQLITGGICHRFPELNFVSVESGVGWIPFALEALDWQWKNCGVHLEHPEYDLLPSEYFHRQIYGCFWFERDSALVGDRPAGRRQHPLRDGLPPPDEHVAGTGQRGATARRLPPVELRRSRRAARHARSCTTTQPASTTSTEPQAGQPAESDHPHTRRVGQTGVMPEVVVVGAGMAGAAAAWALARRGRSVLLVDRFGRGHDRGSSHGAERIFRFGYTEAAYVNLAQESLAGWGDLQAAAGAPLLHLTGVVDHGDEAELVEMMAACTAAGVRSRCAERVGGGVALAGSTFRRPGRASARRRTCRRRPHARGLLGPGCRRRRRRALRHAGDRRSSCRRRSRGRDR